MIQCQNKKRRRETALARVVRDGERVRRWSRKGRAQHEARDHITHARFGESPFATMCRQRAQWLGNSDRMAGENEPVTCDGCQRAIWKAEHRPIAARTAGRAVAA